MEYYYNEDVRQQNVDSMNKLYSYHYKKNEYNSARYYSKMSAKNWQCIWNVCIYKVQY
jgi:hypothetical protein